jgi:pimeloyl-ACP methyl ester carboxylesterase
VIAVSPSLTGRLSYNLNIFLMGEIGEWVLGFARKAWPVAIASTMSMYWTPRYLGTEAVERTTDDLRRADWEAARASLDALLAHDYSPYLPEISQPTLVIHGVRDRTVPLADSKIAARALPRARLMTLDGVHHQPMDEVPQLFYQAVRSFLANGYAETV